MSKEKIEQKEEKKSISLSIADLEKQLKQREELKLSLETKYYQVLGQLQLLAQQIEDLKEKEKKQSQCK
jgi:hypothetical protein